jgi:hypothetical protein
MVMKLLFHNIPGISRIAAQLAASQEGLSPMRLIGEQEANPTTFPYVYFTILACLV